MATGSPGTNGVWLYGEDDSEATFSALLNKAGTTVNTQLGLDRGRLTTLEARPLSGLVPLSPASVVVASGTASTNSLGQVTFTSASALSLNGIFTSAYKNYKVYIAAEADAGQREVRMRFRSTGTDNTTTNYYYALSIAVSNGTAVNIGAGLQGFYRLHDVHFQSTIYNIDMTSPNQANDTAASFTGVYAGNGVMGGAIFGAPTVFDGFTIYTTAGNMTGTLHVYGYND
jgi:hypothetical protein